MVRVHPGSLTRLRQATGRPLRLKPGDAVSSNLTRATKKHNTPLQSSQECSPSCHDGDRRFESDRGCLSQTEKERELSTR